MKYTALKVVALSLPFFFGTAVADNNNPAADLIPGLTAMSDVELGEVSGTSRYRGRGRGCRNCYQDNYADVYQVNHSERGRHVRQSNSSNINQSNS